MEEISNFLEEAKRCLQQTGHIVAARIAERLTNYPIASFKRNGSLPDDIKKQLDTAFSIEPRIAFSSVVEAVSPHLNWQSAKAAISEGESENNIPSEFINGHAYTEIIGPDGSLKTHEFRLGLYIQYANVFYKAHAHAAEETYYSISGISDWQANFGAFKTLKPGELYHNPPHQIHAMKSGNTPLLAMWVWEGDITFDSYRFCEEDLQQ